MRRITIALDEPLAEQLEAFCTRHGYGNRSEAFRDLLRERLQAEQLARAPEGDCAAILSYVYDHHERELAARMTRIQHDRHDLTVSTLHVHLDHAHCMEAVVLRGPTRRVQAFADAVMAQPGIRHAKLHLLPVAVHEQAHRHGTDAPHAHLHLEPLT